MELGGNAPFIVFDDADVDRAIEGAMIAKYRNSGQTCVCTNRFLVQSGIHDAFVEKLAAASNALKVGNGLEPGVQQGPLIDDKAVDKVEEHIADARRQGRQGRRRRQAPRARPHLLRADRADRREAGHAGRQGRDFGPLAPVFKFETEEEAVAMANDTDSASPPTSTRGTSAGPSASPKR